MKRLAGFFTFMMMLILSVPLMATAGYWDIDGNGIAVNINSGNVSGRLDKAISIIEVYRNGQLLDREELAEDYGYITEKKFNYSLYVGNTPLINPFQPGDKIKLLNHNTPEATTTKTPTLVYEFTIPHLTASITKNEAEGISVITGNTKANQTVEIYLQKGNDWVTIGETATDANGQFTYELRPGLANEAITKLEITESIGDIDVTYDIHKGYDQYFNAHIEIPYGPNHRQVTNEPIPLKVKAFNSAGEELPVTNIQWSVLNEEGQPTTAASIDESGNFIATSPGNYSITAILPEYNNEKVDTQVYVTDLGEPARIHFYPKTQNHAYTVNEPVEFDVDLLDQDGKRLLYNGSFYWEIEKYDRDLDYNDPRDPDHNKFIPSWDATMTPDRIFTATTQGHYRITLTADDYPDLPMAEAMVLVYEDLHAAKLEATQTILNIGEELGLDFGIYDSNYNELPLEFDPYWTDGDKDKFQYNWSVANRTDWYTHIPVEPDSYTTVNGPEGIFKFYKPGKYSIFFNVTKQINYYADYVWGGPQTFIDIEVKDPAFEQVKDIRITQTDYPETYESNPEIYNFATFKVEALDENGQVVNGVNFDYEIDYPYSVSIDQNGLVNVPINGMWDGYYLKATVIGKPEISKTHYFEVFSPDYLNVGSVELERVDNVGVTDTSTIYTRHNPDIIEYGEQYLQGYLLKITVKNKNGEIQTPGDFNDNYQGTAYLYAQTLDGKPTDNITFSDREMVANTILYAEKPGDYKIIAKSVENPQIQAEMIIHVVDRGQAIRTAGINVDPEQKPYAGDVLVFDGKALDSTGNEIPNEFFRWAVYNEDGSVADDVKAQEYYGPRELSFYNKTTANLVFPRTGNYKVVATSTINPLIKAQYDIVIESKPSLAEVSYDLLYKNLSGIVPEGVNGLTIKLLRNDEVLDTVSADIWSDGEYYQNTWQYDPIPGDTIVLEYDNGTSESFVIEDIKAVYDANNQTIFGKTGPNQEIFVTTYESTEPYIGNSDETGKFEITLNGAPSLLDFTVVTRADNGVKFAKQFWPITPLTLDSRWHYITGNLPTDVPVFASIKQPDGTIKLDKLPLDPFNYQTYLGSTPINNGDIVTLHFGDFYERSVSVLTELPVQIDNNAKTISGQIPNGYEHNLNISIGNKSYTVGVDSSGYFTFSFDGLTNDYEQPIHDLTIDDFVLYIKDAILEMKVQPIEGPIVPPPTGNFDHDGDGDADSGDLKIVIDGYGEQAAPGTKTDLNADGVVDIFDIIKQARQLRSSQQAPGGGGGAATPIPTPTPEAQSGDMEATDSSVEAVNSTEEQSSNFETEGNDFTYSASNNGAESNTETNVTTAPEGNGESESLAESTDNSTGEDSTEEQTSSDTDNRNELE